MAAQDNLKCFAIAGRTASGAATAVDDVDQEELRLPLTALLTPGYLPNLLTQAANPNAFRVRQNTGTDMNVLIGSGTTKVDGYVLLGGVAGQGAYAIRLDATTKAVAVPATDVTNPARYGVYAFIDDTAYSGDPSRAYANVTCIRGTPAGSPVTPTALAVWSASALLWEFQLPANATAVTNTILDAGTDQRAPAGPAAVATVAQATASVGPFTVAETTVVSVTRPIKSTRAYRISYTFPCSCDVLAQIGVKLTDLSNTALITRSRVINSTSVPEQFTAVEYITGVTATGFRMRVVRQSGSGNVTLPMSATSPATLIVDDLGPP
jgi:hypothetical protein